MRWLRHPEDAGLGPDPTLLKPIRTPDALAEALADPLVLLFKHSTACWLSQQAKRQIEAELEAYVQRWQAAHSRAEALRTLCVQDAQRVDKARDLGEQREIEDAFQARLHRSAAA